VDKPTEDWKGGRGYINKDQLLKALPSPSDDTVILVDAQQQARMSTVDKACYVKQY
jgi:hypothetical protein